MDTELAEAAGNFNLSGKFSADKLAGSVHQYAQSYADQGGKKERNQRPFPGQGFFFYAGERCSAGPVEKHKDSHGQGGFSRPSLADQKLFKGEEGGEFHNISCLQIQHKQNRKDNFPAEKSQDKGGKDDSIQPHQCTQWIQYPGKMNKQVFSPVNGIGSQP